VKLLLPGIVVSGVRTLDSIISDAASQPRMQSIVFTALTTLAVTIAAVGLYGVVAFSVTQQTREIGIRIALGAARHRVLLMVMREGMTIAVIGLVAGSVLALAAVRLLRASLYGISYMDPWSFVAAAILLLVVANLAAYLPAIRATDVDPLTLRHD